MLFFSILILVLLLNGLIIYFLKIKKLSFYLPKWLIGFAFILFCLGLWLIYWQNGLILTELSKRNWNHVDGEIIASEIVGERAIHAEIKYKYEVNDSSYISQSDYNIPGFGSKNYRRKNARIVKNKNKVGEKVKVYYDPNKPGNSTLRYGPYWSNYMIFGFGSILLMVGMFGLLWVLLPNKIKEA